MLLTARPCLIQVAKLDKASFLAELRGVGSNKGTAVKIAAGTGPATAGPPQQPQPQEEAAGAAGWGVLSDSFGVQGRPKLISSLPAPLAY